MFFSMQGWRNPSTEACYLSLHFAQLVVKQTMHPLVGSRNATHIEHMTP